MHIPTKPVRALILLFFPVLLWGQSTELRRLSLDEIVQIGLANSKQLQITNAKLMAAHAKTSQLGDAFIPSVNYNGSYTRLSKNVPEFGFTTPNGDYRVLNPLIPNNFSNRFSLSEVVFTGFRALNAIKASEFLETAAKVDVERDQKEVQLNLLNAGITLYKLEQAKRTFEANLNTARQRVTDMRNLRAQGLALDNDVLKAELGVAQLETAKSETEHAISATAFSLSVLLGLPESTSVQVDSASVASVSTPDGTLESFLNNATNRADVRAAGLRTEASAKQLSGTKGAMLPLVSVGANLYINNPNQRFFPPEDVFHTTWDAGLSLSWNLTSLYTSRHTIEESKANLLSSNLQQQQLTDAARTEIANQFYAWQTARDKQSLYALSVKQAVENQKVILARQRQQTATATELLDADALRIQAEINRVTAESDMRLAYFRLLKSAGKL
ncbi:MAG: TolC family protein [Bacteroidota bacterium]